MLQFEKRVFIHHDGALGDLLLSLPAIASISCSASSLHISGQQSAALLLKDCGCCDEVFDSGGAFFSSFYDTGPDDSLRRFLSGYDRAYVFTVNPKSSIVGNVRSSVPDTTAILTIPPEGVRIHAADYRLNQLDGFSLLKPSLLSIPKVHIERAEVMLREGGFSFDRTLIAIHPGSGGRRKCWPPAKYAEVMHKLRGLRNVFFIVFSGPVEEGEMERDLTAALTGRNNNVLFVRNEGFGLVSALLGLSNIYIGNDSGITHLAAAVNTKVIAIFGPTDPVVWRPVGNHVRVIAGNVACAPCGDAKSRECEKRVCLEAVGVETVVEEIEIGIS